MDFETYYAGLQKQVKAKNSQDDDFNKFYDGLRMDIGAIPDTRPTFSQQTQQFGGFPSLDASKSPLMKQVSQVPIPEPSMLDHTGWNGIIDNPIGRTIGKGFQAVGDGFDYVEEKTGLDHLRGLAQGALNPTLPPDIPSDGTYLGQYKNIFDNASQALKSVGKSAAEGFKYPENARNKFNASLDKATANMDPVARFGLSFEANTATDPINYVPVGTGMSLAAKGLRKVGDLTGLRKLGDVGAVSQEVPTDMLALPAPSPLKLREGTIPSGDPIPAYGDVKTFELPEPNIEPATTARIEQKVNPYRQKYEELASAVQQMDVPPGREYEAYQDIWSRMAGPKDPSLDQLVELAYPTTKSKLAPDLVQRAKSYQGSRQLAGVNLPVKSFGDRYNGFVGAAESPIDGGFQGLIKKPKGEILRSSPEPQPGLIRIQPTKKMVNAEFTPITKTLPKKDNVPVAATREHSPLDNSDQWKNKGKLALGRETMTRNFEDIMTKEDANLMNETYIEPIGHSEAGRQRFLKATKDKIRSFGIKYKSADDKLVQKYGEGVIGLDELKQQTPNWEKVKGAAESMRSLYDNLLTTVNTALERNGYPPIPKRENYFPHYEEIDNIMSKLGIKMENHELPTDINGLTGDFKPGKNFFRHALQRKGNQTTYGFLEGADRYLEGVSRLIYHTDNVQRLRGLEKEIRTKYEGDTHLSDLAAEITDFTNALAGKKSKLDRGVEERVGRKLYSVVDTMRRRVGANAVGGSISSALTNFIPLTQSLATTSKPAFVQGMLETMRNVVKNDGFAAKSDFLARREAADPLAADLWYKAGDKASWLFKTIDRFTSQTVVRSKFLEGKKAGLGDEEAMKQADAWAARLMTDRSFGAQPTMFNSRVLGLFTQFQAEVNNQLSFLFKDIPRSSQSKAAAASALGQVFLYSYVFNNLYEKATGNRPAFDPVGIAIRAVEDFNNEDLNKGKAASNLLQNVANNVPFLSTVVGGGRIPLSNAFPNVTGLIDGTADVKKELQKPLYGLLFPFGGNQVKKTIQGVSDYSKGGSYTDSNGEEVMKYPIQKDNANMLRGSVFGANSFPEAQDYFRNAKKPLTKNQTESVEKSSNPSLSYGKILSTRKIDDVASKIKDIRKDKNLTSLEKEKKIEPLIKKYDDLKRNIGR